MLFLLNDRRRPAYTSLPRIESHLELHTNFVMWHGVVCLNAAGSTWQHELERCAVYDLQTVALARGTTSKELKKRFDSPTYVHESPSEYSLDYVMNLAKLLLISMFVNFSFLFF